MTSNRSSSGVTLTELLVSLVIITIILSAIFSFYGTSIKHNISNQIRSELKFIAEQEMEKVLALPYDAEILNAYGAERVEVYEYKGFIVKRSVVILDPETSLVKEPYPLSYEDDSKLKQVTVSVARMDGRGPQVDLVEFKTP